MNSISAANRNRFSLPRDLVNRPTVPTTPASHSGPQDTVTLSSEALRGTEVADARCGNNWRCLKALHDRGLLA